MARTANKARCTCRHGTHGEGTGHAPPCPACPLPRASKKARCTCRHGTHGEGTGHAPLCPACPLPRAAKKEVKQTFALIDLKDTNVKKFLLRELSTFPVWAKRADLPSAMNMIRLFAAPDIDLAIVELVSSGRKDRFKQELIDRVILRDARGSEVKSWNPQR